MTGFRFSFWKPCENRHLSHNILITFAADVQRSVLHIAFQARRSLSCFIIIHCSATRCDQTTPRAAQARPLATRLHRRRLSLLHPYYIRKDGTTTQHRRLNEVDAHCRPFNRCSIGICYEGGLDANGKSKDTRTIAQRGSLVALLIKFKKLFPKAFIRGHNEMPGATPKSCPNFKPSTEFAYLMK